jgi:hypothetical protein
VVGLKRNVCHSIVIGYDRKRAFTLDRSAGTFCGGHLKEYRRTDHGFSCVIDDPDHDLPWWCLIFFDDVDGSVALEDHDLQAGLRSSETTDSGYEHQDCNQTPRHAISL